MGIGSRSAENSGASAITIEALHQFERDAEKNRVAAERFSVFDGFGRLQQNSHGSCAANVSAQLTYGANDRKEEEAAFANNANVRRGTIGRTQLHGFLQQAPT